MQKAERQSNGLLSFHELSGRLGRPETVLRLWHQRGTLPIPSVRIGHRIFFKSADVDVFLKAERR